MTKHGLNAVFGECIRMPERYLSVTSEGGVNRYWPGLHGSNRQAKGGYHA